MTDVYLQQLLASLDRIESGLGYLPESERSTVRAWVNATRSEASRLSVRSELGFVPYLIAGGLLAAGAIGAWVYTQWEQSQRVEAYIECLKMHEEQGLSPEEASKVCRGGLSVPVWVWIAIGAGAVLALVTARR